MYGFPVYWSCAIMIYVWYAASSHPDCPGTHYNITLETYLVNLNFGSWDFWSRPKELPHLSILSTFFFQPSSLPAYITMSHLSLKRFLVEYGYPQQFNLTGADFRTDISRTLYWHATNKGKYLTKLFKELDFDENDHSLEFYKAQDASCSWKLKSSSSNSGSHEGRPCLRKLEKSEPTYRCM